MVSSFVYTHFKQSRNISIKKCAWAQLEICQGTPQENIACIKTKVVVLEEHGEEPHQEYHK